jgi:hypothetical protein
MRLTQRLWRLSLIGKMQIAEWPQSSKSLRARLPAEYLGRGTIKWTPGAAMTGRGRRSVSVYGGRFRPKCEANGA